MTAAMNKHYNFTSDQGIPFVVRIVRKGDRFGLDGCLKHEGDEPMIEFYDARFDHNPWLPFVGQFVSRYYLTTLITHRGGLILDGGVPAWSIDQRDFESAMQWVSDEEMKP